MGRSSRDKAESRREGCRYIGKIALVAITVVGVRVGLPVCVWMVGEKNSSQTLLTEKAAIESSQPTGSVSSRPSAVGFVYQVILRWQQVADRHANERVGCPRSRVLLPNDDDQTLSRWLLYCYGTMSQDGEEKSRKTIELEWVLLLENLSALLFSFKYSPHSDATRISSRISFKAN